MTNRLKQCQTKKEKNIDEICNTQKCININISLLLNIAVPFSELFNKGVPFILILNEDVALFFTYDLSQRI